MRGNKPCHRMVQVPVYWGNLPVGWAPQHTDLCNTNDKGAFGRCPSGCSCVHVPEQVWISYNWFQALQFGQSGYWASNGQMKCRPNRIR